MTNDHGQTQSWFERVVMGFVQKWGITILLSITGVGYTAGINYLNDLNKRINDAVQLGTASKVAVELLNQRIDFTSSDRYTASDAARDIATITATIDGLRRMLERNERAIEGLNR